MSLSTGPDWRAQRKKWAEISAAFPTRLRLRSSLAREGLIAIDSLRSACLSLVPFLVVVSMITLLEDLGGLDLTPHWMGARKLGSSLQSLFPLMMLVSLAYHLCVRYDINRNVGILLALLSAITADLAFAPKSAQALQIGVFAGDLLHSILVPVISVRLLLAYSQLLAGMEKKFSLVIWGHMAESLRLIFPFMLALASLLMLAWLGQPLSDWLHRGVQAMLDGLGGSAFMFVRMLLAHALWSLGLHGDNLLGLMYDTSVLFRPISGQLNYIGFYNLFVLHGGCGTALCLWMAVLISSRDGHGRRVALLATPFIVFNIPEVLIFGLPVILNRHLLLPFFLVPISNFVIGIAAVQSGLLSFPVGAPSWTTPVLLNAVLATGSPLAALVQLVGMGVGVLIYIPFVRRFSASQSSSHQLRRLEHSLDISSALQARSGLQFHSAQASIIESHTQVDKIINLLEHNTLEVHYQPKVDVQSLEVHQHEALLRLRMQDGSLRGPYFLDTLELAGLASTIDLWVCRSVKRDLARWASEQGYRPRIAINLHPETIHDRWFVERIAKELAGEPVDFEIIERGDVSGKQALGNLNDLRQQGFRIALDDFGTGYAGFGSLNLLPLDVIKIDKSLLDAAVDEDGRTVYQAAALMCSRLGLECVAEGVETVEQLALVREAGIQFVQGYLMSRPLPPQALASFSPPPSLHRQDLG